MTKLSKITGRILLTILVLMQLQGCASIAVGAATTAAKIAVAVPFAIGGAVIDMATESEEEREREERATTED